MINVSRYDVVLEHISAHRWYMGIDQKRNVEWEEAVLDWYDNVYLPVVRAIRANSVLHPRQPPRATRGKTEGDLYLWVMDHRWYLREETGQDVGPNAGVLSYSARYGSYRKWIYGAWRFLSNAGVRPGTIRQGA